MNWKFFILLVSVLTLNSCYYDSEDKLYPNQTCDTMSVSYQIDVEPLLQSKCYSCHGDNNTISIIEFQGHADLIATIANGQFLKAIKRQPGAVPMPQGGDKLPDCEINILEAWINQGKQNN